MTRFPRWILAADSSRARIFVQNDAVSDPEEIKSMDHLPSRLHAREILTDRQGRRFESMGSGHRSAMEPDVDPKSEAARTFSKKVVGFIEAGAQAEKFAALVVSAAPKFLGLLRTDFSPQLQGRVTLEIPKNLVPLSGRELLDQIRRAEP